MIPFIMLGSLYFWAFLIIPSLLLIWFVESGRAGFALFTILVAIISIVTFGDPKIIEFITNPLHVGAFILAYIFAGIFWSLFKWRLFVGEEYLRYRKKLEEYNDRVAAGQSTHIKPDIKGHRPNISKNKGRVIFWMAYWPWSSIWWILNDPIIRFYNFLYRKLGKVFDSITNSVFKDVE